MSAYTMKDKPETPLNTGTLEFLRKNVLNVTDITRKKKLTEILDQYSDNVSEEVYVIQNAKRKNSQAVIADLEYFEQLLAMKELVDKAFDEIMIEEAHHRRNLPASLTLSDIFNEEDINVETIIQQLEQED